MKIGNNNKFRNLLIAIFSAVVLVISATGYFYINHHSEKLKREKEVYLNSIVTDRANQIEDWHYSIVKFADLISVSSDLNFYLEKASANKPAISEKKMFESLIHSSQVTLGFKNILLADKNSQVLFALEEEEEVHDPRYKYFSEKTFFEKKPVLSDFYQNPKTKSPQLSFYIPIFSDSAELNYLGQVICIIDPAVYLYPLITQWPVPSKSGEVFISQKVNDKIFYRSPLKFTRNDSSNFWVNASTSDLPAAMDKEGVVEGKDYRGVEVFASKKNLPDIGWNIIAKEDETEIFYESDRYIFYITLIVVALIPISGLILLFVWTMKQRGVYEELFLSQKELASTSEQLANIFRYANDVILIMDKHGQIIRANEKAVSTYGYSIDELQNMHISKLIAEGEKENLKARMEKIYATSSGFLVESIHRKKNGNNFPVEINARKIIIDNNEFIQTIIRDITERKEKTKALETQQNLFKQLFENSPTGIVLLDQDGRVVNVNKGFTNLFQFKSEECYGLFLDDLIVPQNSVPHAEQLFNKVMTKDSVSAEIVRMKKDKTLVDVSLLAYPILLDDKVRGVFGIYTDITEKKTTSDKLIQSEERFRLVAEHTGQLIYDYEIASGNILWSGAIERITQYSVDEFQSFDINKWEEHIHPQDRSEAMQVLEEAMQSGETYSASYRFKRKDNSYITVEDNGTFLYDENNKPYRMLGTMSDITERERVESALRENEKRYHSVVEALNQAYYEANNRGMITYCNPGLYEVSGHTEEELKGMVVYRLVADEHRQMVMAAHKKWMSEKATDVSMEFLAQTKYGKIFWVEQHTHYEYDKNGKFVIATNILRDIDERKRAEEIINKRLEFERIIASISSRFINVKEGEIDREINLALKIVGVVSASDRSYLFFFSKDGTTFYNSHEWCADGITPQIDNLQDIPSKVFPWWVNLLREQKTINIPDVSKMPAEASEEQAIFEAQDIKSLIVVPLISAEKTVGFLGFDSVMNYKTWPEEDIIVLRLLSEIIANTLNRIKSERAIKNSEAKYRSIFESTAEGICGINERKEIKYCNPQFAKMLGYEVEELVGNPFEKYVVDYEQSDFEKKFEERKTGKREIFDRTLVRKDGSTIVTQVAASPDYDERGNFIGSFGMFTEITEKINLLNELTIAKDKAEEMNKVKSFFFANMSHELRTPLIGILGFAELLKDILTDDADESSMAETIYSSGQRLLNTLNMILNISKLEADSLDVKLARTDILPPIVSVFNTYSKLASKQNLDYQFFTGAKELICNVDMNLLNNIFDNLINNAIKFTDKGGVTVNISIEDSKAVVKVTDTGIGIPKDKLRIVFEEFRQASEGHSRSFEGTGLGLTIAKRYTEALGGKIYAESQVDVGTTFTVELPLADTKIFELETPKILSEEVDSKKVDEIVLPTEKKHILLVEDDYIAIEVTRKILSNIFQLDYAGNAEEAFEKVRNNTYDAILMDINLRKGMDGLMVTQEIRKMENYKHTPIIAFTAFAMEEEVKEFLSKGMTHYISKPFSKKQLLDLMAEVFNNG